MDEQIEPEKKQDQLAPAGILPTDPAEARHNEKPLEKSTRGA